MATKNKIGNKFGEEITFKLRLRNHALVSALAAAGILCSIALPNAVAAPLPVPCGGCGYYSGTSTPINFVQAGTLANLDTATGLPVANGTNLTITQTSPTAILNWQNFNIDKGYSVNFVQPSSTSSALNRIWDANPTNISGALTANGQIYLINRNGIIFGNGAQVNAGALIASSLDITDPLFEAGYLTNIQVIPAFSGNSGFVRVDTGAVLNGSRIMLFAPVVENNGSVATADGQAVLAAGNKVYLEASQDPNLRGVLIEVDVNNPGVADSNLADKGLQHTEAGVVTNTADIIAERGNATLIGFAVNQQGRVSATTSVTENGSVKLLARYGVQGATLNQTDLQPVYNNTASVVNGASYDIRATRTGNVTLATGSVTEVVPQLTDASTTTDGQGFKPSIVEVMGNTINMQSGSKIIAPGGRVTLAEISSLAPQVNINSAYQEVAPPTDLNPNLSTSFINPGYVPLSSATDTARVFLDNGSSIDVSGSSTSVSVARNILTVQLRGSQLQDAPLQRNGFLWGKDVYVDIRQGTTLANYSGEEAQIGRAVAERTAAGGSVKLVSTGDVVMKSGSKIDLSGGQIDYTGAFVNTTTLISKGVTYDISKATPNLIYDGIAGTYSVAHNKWGVTQTWNTMVGGGAGGTWDPGYIEGKSAGTLTVLAPHAVINSDIVAKSVSGIYQRKPYVASASGTPYANTWQMMPQGGSLVIGSSSAVPDSTTKIVNYITDSNVIVQSGTPQLNPATGIYSVLPASFLQDIILDSNMFRSATGLDRLAVYSNKTVSVAAGTSVQFAASGSITLKGDTVNMLGSIDAPAGTVNISTALTTASANNIAGSLNVGAAGSISHITTGGQWVNDSLLTGNPDLSKPLTINGGSINLSSGGDLMVEAGTLLDASGGAWLDAGNKQHGGNGGLITLANGGLNSITPFIAQLDGLDLRSYGTAGGKGGALTIKAGDIVLGGTSGLIGALVLPEAFFESGGFTSFNLTAQGLSGLTVSAGTVIEPMAQSLILDRTASLQKSGADVNSFASIGLLPDWQRAPVSISLAQKNGSLLKVDAGAIIRVEPAANISLTSANQLTVLGTLDAPAGSINLSLTTDPTNYNPNQSIWLGSQSELLSQGYFLEAQPNKLNLIQGQVLAGGQININSPGYVIAQQGSLMDVSGTSTNIDLPQFLSGGLHYKMSHVAGDAGSISVQTSAGGFLDGIIKAGVEAGSHAAAGSFSLTLNNNPRFSDYSLATFPLNPAQIQVMAGGSGGFAAQAGLTPGNDAGAGQASMNAIEGKFLLDANALNDSGFDQVSLKSGTSIVLADHANLQTRRSLALDAPQLVANGNSSVSSAQVTIGNQDAGLQALLDPLDPQKQNHLAPTAGTGALNISGQMVDLSGNFLVSGVNQLSINSGSDIRMNGVINSDNTALQGSLSTRGNVTLQADQVYPSTMTQFKLSVVDSAGNPAGNITVLPGQHDPSTVMSAGGQLTMNAADIVQNGAVEAPLGTLALIGSQSVSLGAGSLTSVSADGLTIPYGVIQGGSAWMYDLTGAGVYFSPITAPPKKQLELTAPNIDIKSGATVNLSGGGDLYANEFFAGIGGSVNVLDPAKAPANTYAIIPGVSGFAPYDPQSADQYLQSGSHTKLQTGASVYLAGGNGIPAGYYTLLPAAYALLPGAYRVTAVAGYTDMQPGMGAIAQLDGSQIMAGKFAVVGTGIQDARYSGFAVTPGNVVRTQSEYHDSYANAFFADQANANGTPISRTPVDAGQMIVSAVGNGANLALDGKFSAQPGAGGRGALVDLNGPAFDIVTSKGVANGMVQVTTDSLNKLDAESLLIGGVRTQNSTEMTIGASQVVVDNAGSVLTGPEIILAANDAVTVKSGSDIEGNGTFSGKASDIAIGSATANGDGALLRVSSAAQVTVARTNLAATPAAATLTVEDGATIGAQNAVLLDSSYTTTVGDNAVLKGQALSVAAQSIDIGPNPNPNATSFSLSDALLKRALTFKDLTLHSYNDINFYGAGFLGGLDSNNQHVLNNLVLNSRRLNGIDNAGQTNIIDAANVMLMNNNTGTSAATAYGAGNLTINADQIVLAGGNKSVQGFDTVTFDAAKQIVAEGTSSVTIAAGDANVHSLVLQAGQIAGTNGSDLTIAAGNDVISIKPVAGAAATPGEALNAKLEIVGKSIADDGVINLSAGSVTLHASGGAATDSVTLGDGSNTSATAIGKDISGQTAYAQAGTVSLISDNGGVDIRSGALVDVSGAARGGDAGSIDIAAANGTVSVAGDLQGAANANGAQGSFTLDAKSLTGTTTNALTELNDTLTAGGFAALRDLRVRTGDLVLEANAGNGAARAKANTFNLTADGGSIDVYGVVDSSGTSGGNILLAARDNVTLNAGASLDAHASASGQAGGSVTLETTAGEIDLNNHLIDVHGNGDNGGSVLLRAPRNSTNNDVAVNNTGGTSLNINPGAAVTVEGFKAYAPTLASGQLDATAVSGTLTVAGSSVNFKTEATDFSNNAAAIKTRLGMTANQHLVPGIEIDSSGDLTLATNWDLSSWRFNDGNGGNSEPGILTFRVAGNLNFGTNVSSPAVTSPPATATPATPTTPASLTDGFSTINNVIPVSNLGVFPTFTPVPTASWSYRLVAGADSTSADVMAVSNKVPATGGTPTTGNLTLVAGSEYKGTGTSNKTTTYYSMEQIRTGTGFIDIAAGGNLTLGNRDSVIYTAGQAATGVPAAVSGTNKYFGSNGGDINIRVKGDVVGAATDQLITDWQWRPVLSSATAAYQPAWWINIGSFRQNIGALGGGNVNVSAGGNINNLSAVAPSTGYVNYSQDAYGNNITDANGNYIVDPVNPVTVLSGGNLNVTAGGNINSGVFYVGNGQGSIQAGGSLDATRTDKNNKPLYTVLALGQGNFDVRSGGDLTLQTALNPTLLPQGYSQLPTTVFGKTRSYFFTYGDTSGISLSSLSGNVNLKNDTNIFYSTAPATPTTPTAGFFYMFGTNTDSKAASVYPGSLQAAALGGGIISGYYPTLFPSTNGNLQLVAAGNIWLNGSILMSDAAPSSLLASSTATSNIALVTIARSIYGSVHVQDPQSAILSAGGDIGSATGGGSLILSKSAQVQAGQDVQDINFNIQNLNETDSTTIAAGRDIANTSVTVSGPGAVVLQAGRNVDLGLTSGVTTTGNLANPLLPEQGASVTVMAGLGHNTADTRAFIDKYIDPGTGSTYGADLIAYVNKYGAPQDLTASQAYTYFSGMSKPLQDTFVNQVFFNELKQSGRSAANTGNYQAGYDAIATLFPSSDYKGDINLYYSQIKTVRGGDINLFTPGGSVNAGLANVYTTGPVKTAAQLGVVTVKGGDINAFVSNDFTVNQSRVFTLQGGNILMWSSYGNIDAGKGSKTATATPPPLLVVDPKTGAFNVDVTQSVVGSGIRVLLANKDVVPGTVDLYAPAGEINAGDAGIGSAGNIFLGAQQVIGASNINFGGTGVGVPVTTVAPVSIGGMANIQDASKVAEQATQSVSTTSESMASFRPTFLSVEVIGLGDEGTSLQP